MLNAARGLWLLNWLLGGGLLLGCNTADGGGETTEEGVNTTAPMETGNDSPNTPGEPSSPEPSAASTEPTPSAEPSETTSDPCADADPASGAAADPCVAVEPESSPPVPDAQVTWHQDIAPLVSERCSGCHYEGGIGPFALETYEQAHTLGPLLLAAIEQRLMPPWGARETEECVPRFAFKDDLSFSDEEIALFNAWVAADMPEGDPATASAVPAPPDLALTEATLSLDLPNVSVEGTEDRFLCFSLDPGLSADAWLTATQVVPGNAAVVHHVLTYLDSNGESLALADENGSYECFGGPGISGTQLIGAWAPGAVPQRAPEGVAMTLPAGSRLVVNVHYHPTGAAGEMDTGTRLDLAFTDEEPAYDGQLLLIGNFSGSGLLGELLPGPADPADGPAFSIPANVTDHTESMRLLIPAILPQAIIWAVGTHMHYVGTDMLMTLRHASPSAAQPAEECLLQTPAWDFNWQRGYRYDAPLSELPTAGPGDILDLRCTYNNSLSNKFVREALDEQGLGEPHDVVLGEQTLDEMCLGVFGVAYPR